MQNTVNTDNIPTDKKVQAARIVIKWMPYLTIAVLAVLVMQCVGLAKHPGTEHLIRLIGPVGITLCCLSRWSEALVTLKSERKTWQMPVLLSGLLMTGAGPSLGDMYHHKQILLLEALGWAVIVIVAFCMGMLVWEIIDIQRAKPRKQRFSMTRSEDDQTADPSSLL